MTRFSSSLIIYKQPDPNLNGNDGEVCRREGIVTVDGGDGGSAGGLKTCIEACHTTELKHASTLLATERRRPKACNKRGYFDYEL